MRLEVLPDEMSQFQGFSGSYNERKFMSDNCATCRNLFGCEEYRDLKSATDGGFTYWDSSFVARDDGKVVCLERGGEE